MTNKIEGTPILKLAMVKRLEVKKTSNEKSKFIKKFVKNIRQKKLSKKSGQKNSSKNL